MIRDAVSRLVLSLPARYRPHATRLLQSPATLASVLLAITITIAVSATHLWHARNLADERAETELANVTLAAANILESQLSAVDHAMAEIAVILPLSSGGATPGDPGILRLLQGRLDAIKHVRGFYVSDRHGRFIHNTETPGLNGADRSDREYFTSHRDRKVEGLFSGAPIASRTNAQPVLPLSRRIDAVDGTFWGVVAVSLSVVGVEALFGEVRLHSDSTIGVWTAAGSMIARFPQDPNTDGLALLRSLVDDTVKAGQELGQRKATGPTDDKTRLMRAVRLNGLPFFVAVSLSESAYLREWRDQVVLVVASVAIGFGLLIVIVATVVRQTERSLRQIGELAEAVPAIVYICGVDGITAFVNRRWTEYTGVPSEDAVGGPWEPWIHPEDAGGARKSWRHSIETGTDHASEFRLRSRDGDYRWHLSRAVAIRGEDGLVSGWYGTATDIDDVRRAEMRAHDAEAAFRALFDDLPIGISETKVDGGIVAVNAAWRRMYGFGETEDLTGTRMADLYVDPVDRERLLAKLTGANSAVEMESLRRRRDGTQVWIEWHGRGIFDANGRLQKLRSTHIDITARKLLESQLRQAQKMEAVGQLTGGIAHDFNNLLTVILGSAETLTQSLADSPRLQHLARMTSAAAQRGADLTHSLLAFARQQTLQPKITDVNDLVTGMHGLLRRALGEHIEFGFARGNELGSVSVDPSQLESAILNLTINARDAMPGGGKLTIETANAELDRDYAQQNEGVKPGFYVSISVSDTGTGMPPEVAAKVFEPFFTTKEVGKGTGLGLSMVYGFIKQSGGHVKIYSEVGHGTTVKLYLPRLTGTEKSSAAASVSTVELRGGSETILVAEDDDMVRAFVENQLAGLGYCVLPVRDGAEALAVLRQGRPIDLLFTDMVMPGGMSGSRLAAEARRLRPALKILFTSGYARNAFDKLSGNEQLGDRIELLAKPYQRHELAAKLRKVLDAAPDPS